MGSFKFPLVVCLLIFHSSKSSTNRTTSTTTSTTRTETEIVEIENGQLDKILDRIKEVQEASLLKVLAKYKDETNSLMSVYMENLSNMVNEGRDAQKETYSLLESNMDRTEAMMNRTNDLLKTTTDTLLVIKRQKEAKTFDDLTEVKKQVGDKIEEAFQGTVHLFTEEVRYPQQALGFFSLESKYNKKVAPSNKLVRGWMKPTFVTEVDSMKQKMGLEIYFVLMWQEDSSRVNWALQNEMQNGSTFSFSPAILEYA